MAKDKICANCEKKLGLIPNNSAYGKNFCSWKCRKEYALKNKVESHSLETFLIIIGMLIGGGTSYFMLSIFNIFFNIKGPLMWILVFFFSIIGAGAMIKNHIDSENAKLLNKKLKE